MESYDFTIIGGGSAGYAAARTAHSLGMKTAVVDGAGELGGLCILRGCMPSKALIESADRNLTIKRAAEFGIQAQPGQPDMSAIRQRKRLLIEDFASYRQQQLQDGRFTLIRGTAAFESPHTLKITPLDASQPEQLITSKYFCLATGSVSFVPDIPGLKEAGYWTSDEVLDTDTIPASCIVLGGGAIALEMAHFLDGVGCQVTLIQRSDQLLSGTDREASDVVIEAYRKRGISVYCGTQIESVTSSGDGKKHIHFTTSDGRKEVAAAEQILTALGRRPNSQKLGLDQAAVSLRKDKVETQPTQQTSQPHIFAAGDIASPLDVVHLAIQQGEIAARNAHRLFTASSEALETMDYRLQLFGVFSHPQVAVVGTEEAALRDQGVPLLTASYPFNDHGRSMTMGETEGFVKMLAHADSGEILGAVCVGPQATEIIHEIVAAMRFHCTVKQFLEIPHYHPTLSEIWTYPAEEILDQITAVK